MQWFRTVVDRSCWTVTPTSNRWTVNPRVFRVAKVLQVSWPLLVQSMTWLQGCFVNLFCFLNKPKEVHLERKRWWGRVSRTDDRFFYHPLHGVICIIVTRTLSQFPAFSRNVGSKIINDYMYRITPKQLMPSKRSTIWMIFINKLLLITSSFKGYGDLMYFIHNTNKLLTHHP